MVSITIYYYYYYYYRIVLMNLKTKNKGELKYQEVYRQKAHFIQLKYIDDQVLLLISH